MKVGKETSHAEHPEPPPLPGRPQPERVARQIVDDGFTANYDYALQTMTDVPYNKWREYDPEDTIRFYALRLQEAGMIKSGPQKFIADGTDWRFLNELKRELKT
ncbi:MAG: hypothetical protein AAAB20_00665 [Rhizobium sp.]|uniref:hypothetical protein n=1 Tax=Rhizobium sp. TaxID=391 RepID=UPI00056B44FE